MKRTIAIFASLVMLASCGNRVPSNDKQAVNAQGLKGIGTISLGLTTSEVISAIEDNNSSFRKKCTIRDIYSYSRYMGEAIKDVNDYSEKDCSFYLSEKMKLELTLGFYRDSLVIVRVDDSFNGAREVSEAFHYKYGYGVVSNVASNGKFPLRGLAETWTSESVQAVYYYYENEYEYVEMTPLGRDIKEELLAYKMARRAREENKRIEALKNI